ncbi:uncharacterized protein V6R79_004295 [Siganus canaliculatus]
MRRMLLRGLRVKIFTIFLVQMGSLKLQFTHAYGSQCYLAEDVNQGPPSDASSFSLLNVKPLLCIQQQRCSSEEKSLHTRHLKDPQATQSKMINTPSKTTPSSVQSLFSPQQTPTSALTKFALSCISPNRQRTRSSSQTTGSMWSRQQQRAMETGEAHIRSRD